MTPPAKEERQLDSPVVYERLREVVSATGKSQVSLAKEIGISRAYLVKILGGKVALSGSAIKALMRAGFDMEHVITGEASKDQLRHDLNRLRERYDAIVDIVTKAMQEKRSEGE